MLLRREGDGFGDVIPFIEAVAATAGAGVLGDEDGVPAHRGLLAVVWNRGGCKPRRNEVRGVTPKFLFAEFFGVGAILFVQVEARTERGFRKFYKGVFGRHIVGTLRDSPLVEHALRKADGVLDLKDFSA